MGFNKKVSKRIDQAQKFGMKYMISSLSYRMTLKYFPNSYVEHTLHKISYKNVEKYIIRRYGYIIDEYKNRNFIETKINETNIIWISWWQGYNKAPTLVKECIERIKINNPDKKVILIDKNNINDYIELPKVILKKVNKGIYTYTFLSDVIRTNLLAQYGGIWIDSTVFIDSSLDYLDNFKFYTVRHNLYSSWHVCRGKWTGFFLACGKENLGMNIIAKILLEYARNEDRLIAYFLIDAVIATVYDSINSFKNEVNAVPINNREVFKMDSELNNKYVGYHIPCLVNKLSYKHKYKIETKKGESTVYKALITGKYTKKNV